LKGRHKKTVVIVTALARELCGFVWAIACQMSAPEKLKLSKQKPVYPTRKTKSTGVTHRVYQLDPSRKFKK
jgi:hypothetical protein